MKTSRSEALFALAQARIPGGVNSPVRAFRSVGGAPRFIERVYILNLPVTGRDGVLLHAGLRVIKVQMTVA